MAMNCKKCNSELRPAFRFCPICGGEIVKSENEVPYDKDDYPEGFNPELYELEKPR